MAYHYQRRELIMRYGSRSPPFVRDEQYYRGSRYVPRASSVPYGRIVSSRRGSTPHRDEYRASSREHSPPYGGGYSHRSANRHHIGRDCPYERSMSRNPSIHRRRRSSDDNSYRNRHGIREQSLRSNSASFGRSYSPPHRRKHGSGPSHIGRSLPADKLLQERPHGNNGQRYNREPARHASPKHKEGKKLNHQESKQGSPSNKSHVREKMVQDLYNKTEEEATASSMDGTDKLRISSCSVQVQGHQSKGGSCKSPLLATTQKSSTSSSERSIDVEMQSTENTSSKSDNMKETSGASNDVSEDQLQPCKVSEMSRPRSLFDSFAQDLCRKGSTDSGDRSVSDTDQPGKTSPSNVDNIGSTTMTEDTSSMMSDDDEDDDDDDEDLPSLSTWWRDLEDMSTKPLPSTPVKSDASGQSNDPADVAPSRKKAISQPHTKITLDKLLEEKVPEDDDSYIKMKDDLQQGIEQGGIHKLSELSFSQEGISEEHEAKLARMMSKEREIEDHHPGEKIFDQSLHMQLFTQHTLSLKTCGFKQEHHLEKRLCRMSNDCLHDLLTSDICCVLLPSLPHSAALLRWLFFLLSIHADAKVVEGITKTLISALQNSLLEARNRQWHPTVQDVLTVFVNYGATFNRLLPEEQISFYCEENMRKDALLPPPLDTPPGGDHQLYNFNCIVDVLHCAIYQRASSYNEQELYALFVILLKVSLDATYRVFPKVAVQGCLATILDAMPNKSWLDHVSALCHTVANMDTHHHNKVFLVQLLPVTKRGRFLRQRLSFSILSSLLFDAVEFPVENIQEIKIDQLQDVVPTLRFTQDTDYYFQASVITLVDLTVGNEPLSSTDKKQLHKLIPQMKLVTSKLRDKFNQLDTSRVKDMLVRVVSKWKLMAHGLGRQTKMFEFHSPKKKVNVERVRSTARSDSESDSEEKLEMQ